MARTTEDGRYIDPVDRTTIEAAIDRAYALIADSISDSAELGRWRDKFWQYLGEDLPFTRSRVVSALNEAAEDAYETNSPIKIAHVLNLAVTSACYLLTHPGADLDEIILAEYEFSPLDLDTGGSETVPDKGSGEWNAAVTNIVLGRSHDKQNKMNGNPQPEARALRYPEIRVSLSSEDDDSETVNPVDRTIVEAVVDRAYALIAGNTTASAELGRWRDKFWQYLGEDLPFTRSRIVSALNAAADDWHTRTGKEGGINGAN